MHARIGWQGLRKSEFLSSGNYYIITGTDFDNNRINLKNISYISKDRYDQDKNIQVHPNDILLTKDGTIGKVAYVDSLDKPATLNAGVYDIKNKSSELETKYLFHYLTTNRLLDYAKKSATGGTIKHLNQKILVDFPIEVSSKNEEKNIANLLDKIDKIITLQQRKMDNLSKIQKSLENNLFPDINHVRKLKASKNNWHTKKLNNIFNERKKCDQYGQLLSVSMTKGVYPFNPSERKDNSSSNKSNYKVVRKGDIAYNSMRMWQGACGVSKYDGIVSPAYTVITPGSNEDASFYYYYFKNNRMKFEFRRHSQGLTSDTWNLKFPLFKDITIEVPNNEKEQIRIRKLLDTLNEAIKHGNGRIRKLKLLKSFLLQKMFI